MKEFDIVIKVVKNEELSVTSVCVNHTEALTPLELIAYLEYAKFQLMYTADNKAKDQISEMLFSPKEVLREIK